MSRKNLPPVMDSLTHDQGMKPCLVMTDTAVHTVKMSDGTAYACIVHNHAEAPAGAVLFMDRAEAELLISLLNNALDDADRINAGKQPYAREGGTGSVQ